MKKASNTKKTILLIVILVVVIAAIVAGVAMIEKWQNSKSAKGKSESAKLETQTLYFGDDEYEITHNIETYLLIGTDDSGNIEAEGTKEYRGQMADFLVLLVLDRSENKYGFLQLNRDTMTDVPFMDTEGNGEDTFFEQMCIAHWYGGMPEMGCNNTVAAVSDFLGELRIDGYYSIHMSQIGTVNHSVGGVEVTLENDFSKEDPAMTKGKKLVLSDEQAEIFVRGRMNVDDGENTSRMQRQRQYMSGLKTRMFEKMESDPNYVNDLLESLDDLSVSDVPNNRMSVIVNTMYKSEDLGILTYDGEVKEADTLGDGIIHTEFYADMDSVAEALVTLCGIEEEHITRDAE